MAGIDCDEVTIKCSVEFGGEAEAVAGVEAVIGMGGPGEYVAGNEEFWDGVAGDAATVVVGGEDEGAEGGLFEADFGDAQIFCGFGWRGFQMLAGGLAGGNCFRPV